MLGVDKSIHSHKKLQQLVKGCLVLFKTTKTGLKPTSEKWRSRLTANSQCLYSGWISRRNSFIADVQIFRENRFKECIDVVTLFLTLACFDIARQDLGTALMENYVHADETFRLASSPRNTVTRSSVSCHSDTEKIQHSNNLSLIYFRRKSKVEYLIVNEFLFAKDLIASLRWFVGFAQSTGRTMQCIQSSVLSISGFFLCGWTWKMVNSTQRIWAHFRTRHVVARCSSFV